MKKVLPAILFCCCITPLWATPYQYVDLGLSVLWATHNIGASTPYQSGDYFAWGETAPWELSNDQNRPAFLQQEVFSHTTYDSEWFVPSLPTKKLPDKRDAAHVLWGEHWRMPTRFELEELVNRCTWTWSDYPTGYKVTGPNGNSIFLPAAGEIEEGEVSQYMERGYYLARTHDYFPIYSADTYLYDTKSCDLLWFDNGNIRPLGYSSDGAFVNAYSIRPVWSETEVDTAIIRMMKQRLDTVVFNQYEVTSLPEFPGGGKALEAYVAEHRSKSFDLKDDIQIWLKLLFDPQGRIIKILDVCGPGDLKPDPNIKQPLEQDAIRVIQSMPQWTPATCHGYKVHAECPLIIDYRLTDDPNYVFTNRQTVTPAAYPGGQAALQAFISERQTTVPGYYFANGRINARCVIEPDGSVTITSIKNDTGSDVDSNEAFKVLEANVRDIIAQMPRWTAGTRDDKNVRVAVEVPFRYEQLPHYREGTLDIYDLVNHPLGIKQVTWQDSQRKVFKAIQQENPGLLKDKQHLTGTLDREYICYDRITMISLSYVKKSLYCSYIIPCKSIESARLLNITLNDEIRKGGYTGIKSFYHVDAQNYWVEIEITK